MPKARPLIRCDHCMAECFSSTHRTVTQRFCSLDCRNAWASDALSPPRGTRLPRSPVKRRRLISEAVRESDYVATLDLIRRLSSRDGECWLWPYVDTDGYGRIAGRAAHRVSVEAKFGQPIGTQPVHHICARRACVNPDHLQPVTHYDNVAEMLARTYMVARIRALESVVAELSPNHPLLLEIGLPQAS